LAATESASISGGNGGLSDRLIKRIVALHRLSDLIIVLLAGLIAWLIRFESFAPPGHYYIAALLLLGSTSVSLPVFGAYRYRASHRFWKAMAQTILAWSVAVLLATSIAYLTKTGEMFSRLWVGYWWVFGLVALPIARYALAKYSQALSRSDQYKEKAILIGTGPTLDKLIALFQKENLLGIKPVAIWALDKTLPQHDDYRSLNTLKELEDLLEPLKKDGATVTQIDQLWIVGTIKDENLNQKIMAAATNSAVRIIIAPDLPLVYDHPWAQAHNIGGMPVIDLAPAPSRLSVTSKRVFDLVVAIPALIVLAPVFAIIAIAIKLDSKGPVFYRQERLTQFGRVFSCLKFRSMRGAETGWEMRQVTEPNDDRITKIGAFLRKTSIDELPQLLNVLVGDMSIVGPRPAPLMQNKEWRSQFPNWMYRHLVKPGVTGLAQISGLRGGDDLESIERRLAFDITYINNWSPLVDLKILLKTIPTLFHKGDAF
jgi:exopolysaccharide biosynthesis polyprenyl glycosylphosphotransferase